MNINLKTISIMIYYVISSDFFKDRPYLRVAYDYDTVNVKLKMVGYSYFSDWKDSSLFQSEEEAREVINTNNPRGENLKLIKITINFEEV